MCDDYTDCLNHKQLTFCLRWVEALKAHETFLGFCKIPDIKSSTIVSVIEGVLTRYQLSMENIRGQWYYGVSNMLGKASGVQWNSKSFSQKQIIHTAMHTPSLYPSKM